MCTWKSTILHVSTSQAVRDVKRPHHITSNQIIIIIIVVVVVVLPTLPAPGQTGLNHQSDYVMRKRLHYLPLELKNFASHLYRTVRIFMIITFFGIVGLDCVQYATLRCYWDWTLDIRPSVVLSLCIVLIQLLVWLLNLINQIIIIIIRYFYCNHYSKAMGA